MRTSGWHNRAARCDWRTRCLEYVTAQTTMLVAYALRGVTEEETP